MVAIQVAVAMLALSAPQDVVLLDFTASWCSPCQEVKPTVHALAAEGYPVRVVDIDQHPDLKSRFRVDSIPCFIVVKNGQEVARQEGVISRQAMIGMLRQAGYGSQAATRPTVRPVSQPIVRAQSPSYQSTVPKTPVFDAQGVPTHPEAKKWRRHGNAPAWRGPQDQTTRFVQVNPYGPPPQAMPPQQDPRMQGPQQGPPGGVQLAGHQTPAAGQFQQGPSPAQYNQTPPPAAQAGFAASAAAPRGSVPHAPAKCDPNRSGQNSNQDLLASDSRDPLVRRLLAASVRLKIKDPDGHSYGSGTIIDARAGEALIITCGHVFRDSNGQGEILIHRHGEYEQTPSRGTLISFDLENDVALVSMPIRGEIIAAKVAARDYAPRRSDRVLSIGCDNGRPATARWSQVTAVNSIVGRPTYQVAGQPEVGRSGGGLFTSDGQLIGICNFADPTDRAGLYAALSTAQEELDQAGLSFVYSNEHRVPDTIATAEQNHGRRADPPAIADTMPLANNAALRTPQGTVAVTPAAQSNNSTRELICIVRGRDGRPTEETLIIKNPSQTLMSRLTEEHQATSGAFFTSGRVAQSNPDALVPVQRR